MDFFEFGNDAGLTTLATLLFYEISKGRLVVFPVSMLFPPRVDNGCNNPVHILVDGDLTCRVCWTLIYLALRCPGEGGGGEGISLSAGGDAKSTPSGFGHVPLSSTKVNRSGEL